MALWRSRVRIPLGPPNRVHSEPHTMAEEQFLALLRFEGRNKLEELPGAPVRDRNGLYFSP
jgi:hypothetical protein